MDIDALTDDDRKQLAKDLAAELDTGLYGNRAVLSRRQLLSIAGGSAGVAGLTALGVDPATAQSAAGQVGTESSPEDVFAFNLDVQGALQRDLDAGGQAISNVGSVSTGKTTFTGRNYHKGNNFRRFEFTGDTEGQIGSSQQFISRFKAAKTPTHLIVIFAGGNSGTNEVFIDKEFFQRTGSGGFAGNVSHVRLTSVMTSSDCSLVHTGSNKEFELQITNPQSDSIGEWTCHVMSSNGELSLQSRSIEG